MGWSHGWLPAALPVAESTTPPDPGTRDPDTGTPWIGTTGTAAATGLPCATGIAVATPGCTTLRELCSADIAIAAGTLAPMGRRRPSRPNAIGSLARRRLCLMIELTPAAVQKRMTSGSMSRKPAKASRSVLSRQPEARESGCPARLISGCAWVVSAGACDPGH